MPIGEFKLISAKPTDIRLAEMRDLLKDIHYEVRDLVCFESIPPFHVVNYLKVLGYNMSFEINLAKAETDITIVMKNQFKEMGSVVLHMFVDDGFNKRIIVYSDAIK